MKITRARKFAITLRRMRRKILNEKLPPNKIAGGWALGMFIGCSIPFGFQLIVSIPLALFLRVSKIGATAGTFITNPITIFFIYPAQTFVVNKLLFGGTLSYEHFEQMEWTREAVMKLGTDVIASFLLGGLLLALLLSPITFFAIRAFVIRARAFREKRNAVRT